MILSIIGAVFISLGLVFFFGTALGLLRFPDFYTRMHAAGKGDTLSTILMLLGFGSLELREIPEHGFSAFLVFIKIFLIGVFIFNANPTASHAISHAGYKLGIKPWKNKNDSGQDEDIQQGSRP